MKLNFEALEQIPQIYQLLNQLNEKVENRVEKKWLSTLETAHYLGYSKDSIDSMVKKMNLFKIFTTTRIKEKGCLINKH